MGKDRSAFRWFEAGVALSGLAAFVVVGPLREVLATLPGVLLAATVVLFLAPGLVLARLSLGGYFSGIALLPASFVVSVALFGLLGVPLLILQGTLDAYLWVAGVTVAVSLLAAALASVPRSVDREQDAAAELAVSDRGGLLWVPFAGLVGGLVYACRFTAPSYFGDIWIYLSWVREYLGGDRLATVEPFFSNEVGHSRARIDSWLLQQAAVSRVSGVDPVDLVFSYLNPTLVVVALLSFYALARILFESEKAALFSGCLYSLFFLIHLSQSRVTLGGEFIQRLPEDKLAAKFLFLPLALAFAVVYLRGGGRRYFACFALLCCAVVAVHPVGLAITGISMSGLAIFHLAANPRSREAWSRIGAMGLAGLTVIAVPLVLIAWVAEEPLSKALANSDINSGDPDVLRNMIFVSPERSRIFEFPGGSYMMHPSLLLDPVIAAAFLIGLPFLLWRIKRSLAAQLLFGTMFITTVVVYVPPFATFLGNNVVLPGQLWRLAWPIPLAAVLTLGWLLWTLTGPTAAWLRKVPAGRYLAGALPLALVVVVAVAAVPFTRPGLESIQKHREASRSSGFFPADPIYPWFRDEIGSPAVVMATDQESVHVAAYSFEADVVSRRGSLVLDALPKLEKRAPGQIDVPRGARDVQEFYSGAALEKMMEILRRNQVDYVMVIPGSEVAGDLERMPGVEAVREPSKRVDVYRVEQAALRAACRHAHPIRASLSA